MGPAFRPTMKSKRSNFCALILVTTLIGTSVWAADSDYDDLTDLKQLSLFELIDLEVTTVSRRAEKLSQAASAVQVITDDDIRRYGANSLPEALRLAGNLHVAQKGAHAWGISARGFNTELANKLLVLIDGRAVYTPLFSGVFWDRQDYLLEDIDRIEVISGPGGTLWGANAVNGVINVISKPAHETQGWYAEAATGSDLEGLVAARYGGQISPNVHFRVYGKYSEHDGAKLANGSDANDPWRMQQGGFRLDARTDNSGSITVQGDVYENTIGQAGIASAKTSGHNLLARWNRELANGSNFSLQIYYDRTHLSVPETELTAGGLVLAPPGTLTDDLDTFDLDFQYTVASGSHHKIIWGLDIVSRMTWCRTLRRSVFFLPLSIRIC